MNNGGVLGLLEQPSSGVLSSDFFFLSILLKNGGVKVCSKQKELPRRKRNKFMGKVFVLNRKALRRRISTHGSEVCVTGWKEGMQQVSSEA